MPPRWQKQAPTALRKRLFQLCCIPIRGIFGTDFDDRGLFGSRGAPYGTRSRKLPGIPILDFGKNIRINDEISQSDTPSPTAAPPAQPHAPAPQTRQNRHNGNENKNNQQNKQQNKQQTKTQTKRPPVGRAAVAPPDPQPRYGICTWNDSPRATSLSRAFM